jgi:hypothetical protein
MDSNENLYDQSTHIVISRSTHVRHEHFILFLSLFTPTHPPVNYAREIETARETKQHGQSTAATYYYDFCYIMLYKMVKLLERKKKTVYDPSGKAQLEFIPSMLRLLIQRYNTYSITLCCIIMFWTSYQTNLFIRYSSEFCFVDLKP